MPEYSWEDLANLDGITQCHIVRAYANRPMLSYSRALRGTIGALRIDGDRLIIQVVDVEGLHEGSAKWRGKRDQEWIFRIDRSLTQPEQCWFEGHLEAHCLDVYGRPREILEILMPESVHARLPHPLAAA